ncbi:hypothetical protein HPB48_017472 [Haemaphysalis longicornis]|uniref:Uncharacterized protein n=1 Tax=Haemaphysalis longicornis TaxID=44386 RepID=A0A9J6FQ80_HAELO|nr:hypothetical protein HPB48_017472 [Haemaphysalis longicornis]
MRKKRFLRSKRRPERTTTLGWQERRAISDGRGALGALSPSSDHRFYGSDVAERAKPKARDYPPGYPSKEHGRPPERDFAEFTTIAGVRGGIDLPLPFTESVRSDGCRCVEHNGPSGSAGGTEATAVASNDLDAKPRAGLECHCVGAAVEDVPKDLGSDVVKL